MLLEGDLLSYSLLSISLVSYLRFINRTGLVGTFVLPVLDPLNIFSSYLDFILRLKRLCVIFKTTSNIS